MKTALQLLIATLLLSLPTFSQRGTNNLSVLPDSVVCIPESTARLIAADLIAYDQCKEELGAVTMLATLLEKQKNTYLTMFEEEHAKWNLCREEVDVFKEQIKIYSEANDKLVKKNKTLKNGNLILGTTTGVGILTTILLIFIK